MKNNLLTMLTVVVMSMGPLSFASTPQSVHVIKFGDASTLFVGDGKSATLYAYEVAAGDNPAAQQGYNIDDLSTRIAGATGVTPDRPFSSQIPRPRAEPFANLNYCIYNICYCTV